MHRSGTSCLTGIMQRLGIELGEVFTQNDFNKKGNRENARIVNLNEALLRLNGGAWNSPVVATNWDDRFTNERDEIITELSSGSTGDWGFKDPRTMFTLDLWLEALPDMKFIGTFRHPYRVALSLNNRDDTPIETGMELWRQYNERLIELHGKAAFDIVDFDAEPQDYLDDVIGKLVRLGVTPSRAEEARDFFDTSLRNQTGVSIDDYDLPLEIELTYKKLQDIYMGSGGTISPGGNG